MGTIQNHPFAQYLKLMKKKFLILRKFKTKIFQLNKRHTPDDIEEKERIEKNGGEISRVDWADYGPLRIFYKNKTYPGLSMTRAFGDFNAENLGFNSIPDIVEYDINEKNPKIIISATDGVWQFLSNEQVKNIILPYLIFNMSFYTSLIKSNKVTLSPFLSSNL